MASATGGGRRKAASYSGGMHEVSRRCADALRGKLIAAAATPMNAAGEIDFTVVRDYFAALMERGADGLAVAVHTGRGDLLDPLTRRTLVEIAREVSPFVVTGVTEAADSADARSWPRIATDAGADALLLFRASDSGPEQTLARCDELWEQTGLPLIAFDLYTRPYPADHLRRLLQHPAVAAFKPARLRDAVACQEGIALATDAGRTVVTGEDRMFGPSLMWGAQGALVGITAACVEASAAVVRAHRDGDATAFLHASRALDSLAEVTFRPPWDGYVQRMLWIAADEGLVPADMAVDPLRPADLSDDERAGVLATARAVGSATRGRRRA